jgi:hypothetical protein
VLGKSTAEEVHATLNELPFVNGPSIGEWRINWLGDRDAIEIFYDCSYATETRCGSAIVSGGNLVQLWTTIGYELTFDFVAQERGDPAYVSFVPSSGERVGCAISLYCPEEQIVATSYGRAPCPALEAFGEGFQVPRDIQVTTITYTIPETFKPVSDLQWPFAAWPGFAQQ